MGADSYWGQLLLTIFGFFKDRAAGIAISLLVIFGLERLFVAVVKRYVLEDAKRHALKKWARYVSVFISVIWVLVLYNSYAHQDKPFYLFLIGLFLAAAALALRDIFSCFIGWIIIMSSRGFKPGDRIKIGDVAGDVIDIGLLRTTVAEIGGWVEADQSSGRLVSVPNNIVLSTSIYNFTEGYDYIWDECKVLITFESNWREAEQILQRMGNEEFEKSKEPLQQRLTDVQHKYLIKYNYISPKVYVTIGNSGIGLALRYMVRAKRRRTLNDLFSRQILEHFAAHPDINLAYPTVRFYRAEEGADAPDTP
jgi:small-conductance mechanosensitive channel